MRARVRDGQFGRGRNELPGIGFARGGAEGFGFAGLDQAAALHDGDAGAEVADERHGVGDEEVGEAVFLLEAAEQIDDLGSDADIEGGNRLVENEKAGPEGQGAGNVDALALAAGELMRMAAERGLVHADLAEQFDCFGPERRTAGVETGLGTVNDEGLGDDLEDIHAGVEGAVGVLKDGLHLTPEATQLRCRSTRPIDAFNPDHAAAGLDEAEDHARERGFAGA